MGSGASLITRAMLEVFVGVVVGIVVVVVEVEALLRKPREKFAGAGPAEKLLRPPE